MKTIAIVKYTFFGIGLLMLIGALWLAQSSRSFAAKAQRAEGVVVALEPSRSGGSSVYHPVFEFNTAQGQPVRVRSASGSNPPSHGEGQRVTVLYAPGNPQDARIQGFFALWGAATIVGGIGSVFFLIGGGMMAAAQIGQRRVAQLRSTGTPLNAEFQSIERNTALQVNGSSPWRIVAQWQNPVTAELHIFKSANLWFDPSAHVPKGFITVYVDGTNTRRYHMDTSFLPRLAA